MGNKPHRAPRMVHQSEGITMSIAQWIAIALVYIVGMGMVIVVFATWPTPERKQFDPEAYNRQYRSELTDDRP